MNSSRMRLCRISIKAELPPRGAARKLSANRRSAYQRRETSSLPTACIVVGQTEHGGREAQRFSSSSSGKWEAKTSQSKTAFQTVLDWFWRRCTAFLEVGSGHHCLLRSYSHVTLPSFERVDPSDPTAPNDRPLTSYVRLCPSFIPLSSFFYPSFTLLSPFFHPNSFEIFEEKLALRNLQFLCCFRSRKHSIFKGHRSSSVYILHS